MDINEKNLTALHLSEICYNSLFYYISYLNIWLFQCLQRLSRIFTICPVSSKNNERFSTGIFLRYRLSFRTLWPVRLAFSMENLLFSVAL